MNRSNQAAPGAPGGELRAPGRGADRRRMLALAAASMLPLGVARAVDAQAVTHADAQAVTQAATQAPAGDARPALRRGINLTHWFEYERGQPVSLDELQGVQRVGFDHVRIPLDPAVFGWSPKGRPEIGFVPQLRSAIDASLRAGLDVVVDMHPTDVIKQQVEDDAAGETAFIALWTALAESLADMPASRVAVELLNEPQYYGLHAWRWPVLQRKLLAAVRRAMPAHLVLLSGASGGSVEGLAALEPLRDAHVAYVFHFYLPYLFTHQGADWMDTRWTTAGLYRDVRYPASAQAGVRPALSRAHPAAAGELASYFQDDWRADRIASSMQPAFEWARKNSVRVVCNEFGVIRAGVQPASRYRWIADVRRTLEAHGVGWSLWDYTDIFGITVESAAGDRSGGRHIEPEALRSLGLRGA
jgi:endoglucanase